MGIKLNDFIKDTHDMFTQEEAEMIYLAAGYVEALKGVNEMTNKEQLKGIENS